MPKTVDEVVRAVRLHCPLADPFLVLDWAQTCYNRVCDRRRWSWLRAEDEIVTNAQKTGTCSVTRGSDIVVAGTLTFDADDVTRQFKVSGPPYTIIALAGADAQLDRTYADGTDAAASGRVLDAYITMPEDFGSFWGVLDPSHDWLIYPWATEDQINFRDPNRSETGEPYVLASRRPATAPASIAGRLQYEMWPYQISAARFPYYYSRRPEDLSTTQFFGGSLLHRPDIIQLLMLAEAAEWPGLSDNRNPYFNLGLAERKRAQAAQELDQLETRDEEIYMTWLETESWLSKRLYHPMSANWLREHE